MGQVAATKTPLTPAQALGALLTAGCPSSALLMAAAQSAVETAGWQSMYGWNPGNITSAGSSDDWFLQGSNAIHFKEYPDATSGFAAFIGWLSSRGLLTYAANNDLAGYTNALRANCYLGCIGRVDANGTTVTQSQYDSYQAGIAAWMAKLKGVVPVAPPISLKRALVYSGAMLGAAGAAWYYLSHR